MIGANRTPHSEKRMLRMKKILHELPPHHFDTFHCLAMHLYKVHMHQDKNKVCTRTPAQIERLKRTHVPDVRCACVS